jgi:sorting nexin-8
VPPIYTKALNAIDPTGTGDVSVNALSRVISTSSLPAATVDRVRSPLPYRTNNLLKPFFLCQIVNLVSSKPRVSKLEFFVAMALVALAQAGSGMSSLLWHAESNVTNKILDISIEQVAVLAAQNELPEPSLDLSAVPPSFSDFATARQDVFPPPLPAYSSEDPWNTATRTPPAHRPLNGDITGGILGEPATSNGMSSSVSGTGLPPKWWMNLESVTVNIKGQQGFILNRYMVYDVTTIVSILSNEQRCGSLTMN